MLLEKAQPQGAASVNTSQPRVTLQKQLGGEPQTWSQKTCILVLLVLPSCATSVRSWPLSEPTFSPLASGENNNATRTLCVPGAVITTWCSLGAQESIC